MGPPERIKTITEIARVLATSSWDDIDFTLEQFGLPTTDGWSGDRFSYVRKMLGLAGDESIERLYDFLLGPASYDPSVEPWAGPGCRIFISHTHPHRFKATEISRALGTWGAVGFVAHEDIVPGAEWQKVILAALHSCDALVALVCNEFRGSQWCDQEVGVAVGRGVPIYPVKLEQAPHGFMGSYQALNWSGDAKFRPLRVAATLRDRLAEQQRTRSRVVESLVHRLADARSFTEANSTARWLEKYESEITKEQVETLAAALEANSQVSGSFDGSTFIERISAPATSQLGPNDAPF